MRIKILLVLFSILICRSVIAATITSAGTGSWNTPATWVGGVVPGASDNVIIANTHNVTANVDITTSGTVTVNTGGTLTLSSGILVNSTINATGAIAWPSGGTVKIGSSANITVTGNISASNTTIEYQNAYVSSSAAKITATGTMAFHTLKSNNSTTKGGSLQATSISIDTYGNNEDGVDVYFNGVTTVANYRGYGATTYTGGTFTVSSSFTANNSGPTNTITSTTHNLIFNVDVVKKGSSFQVDVGNNNVYFNAGLENHWTGAPYSMIVANTVYLTTKIKTEGNAVLYIDANVVQQSNITVNENASGHIYISGNFTSGAYSTDFQNINGTFFVQGNSSFSNITGHLNSTAQLVTLGNSTMNGSGTWLNNQDGPLYVGGTLTTTSTTTFQGTAKAYVNTVTGGGSVTPSDAYTNAPSSVTYNPFPTISGSTSVCVGATITLTGSGTPHASTPWTSASTSVATVSSAGVVTGVAAGTSIITYKNNANMMARVTVTVNATPTITGTTPNSRCGTGTVGLGAAASAGTINWYAASSGGASLGTGTSYTTASISSTTTYYVAATNAGCTTASRTSVVATVNTVPSMTSASSKTICSGSGVALSLTSSVASSYSWIATAQANVTGESTTSQSGATINNTLTNTAASNQNVVYTVTPTATSGGCVGSGQTVTITVNAAVTAGAIGNAQTICSGATPSAISSTTAGTGSGTITYEWQTNASGSYVDIASATSATYTPPSLTATTSYQRRTKSVSGGTTCYSSYATAVTITVNAIPTISGTTPASRCGTGTVGLGATASAGTINWYAASTGGASLGTGTSYTTASISSTTTYYVDATENGCTTAIRTSVVATVHAIPTISGTTPASRCGTGTVGLGATASAGTINWYAASSGGASLGTGTSYTTASISSTTTYYVDATENGCTTASRTSVVATVHAIPTISGTTPASRCGTGTVGLGATASAGTINWYAASSGGASLGTGTSYTTGSISSTTTYYVDGTENGCTTASRTAVVATVTPYPVVIVTNGARAGNGTVSLGASTSGGTLTWYDVAVGGSSLGSGTSYTTPSLTSSATYYVEAVENGCASREPVQATLYKVFYSNNADLASTNNWYPTTTASINIHPSFTDTDITLIVQSGHVCSISSNLTLGSGIILQVDGTIQPLPNVVITGAGTIRGSGTIHVTRIASPADYFSQYDFATLELSDITFNYSGSSNQTISVLPNVYKHLIVSGSGTKSLENSISIAQTLSFDAAVFIDLDGKNITMQNWETGNIYSHGSDRFIVLNGGKIIAEGVTINEVVQFPVGVSANSVDFCRVDITNKIGTHTFTLDGVCEALFSDGTCDGSNGGYVATKKAVDYTWFISSATTNAEVTFYWHTSKELPEFTSNLCSPFHFGSEWELKGVPDEAIVYDTDFRYSTGTFTSFSPGSVQNSEGLLPIELRSFSAYKKQYGVQLEWITETEKNNEYFTLLRSNNGVDFTQIAIIKGSGTTNVTQMYTYFDNSVYYGITYYRLMQTDYDGEQSFSNIISVEQEQKNFDIISFTQSIGSSCEFELQFSDFDSLNTISIVNLLGKVVYEQRFHNTSFERVEIELPQGVYTLRNTSFKSVDSKRFIVR